MGQDSAARHGSHVRVVEAVVPAKRGKVTNGSNGLSARIDEPIMRLDEFALSNAVHMRPALV
jgi:hypothetical protein